MSQLSQHRQRLPSLGITSTFAQPPVPNARPSPLSSHPPTPVDVFGHSLSPKQSRVQDGNHHRQESTSSLPFGSPSNSFPRKQASNFSTPDLSNSASPSIESFSHDFNSSLPDTSFQLYNQAFTYQLKGSASSKNDLSKSAAMSSHDKRHDSIGSSMPLPKGPSSNGRRRSISMQKLFSLSNLKSGFSTSRTSLVSHSTHQSPPTASSDRPTSNSTTSSRGIKRAAEDDHTGPTHNGSQSLQPPLRKRKSGSWFRRKSGLFTFNSANDSAIADDYDMPQGPDAMMLDSPEEQRPVTQSTNTASERPISRQNTQPPVLSPVSPMSKMRTRSSQQSQQQQQQQRPPSSRTFSSQSRASSRSRHQPYSPPTRETFSPPPTLPELGRIDTSFGDAEMRDLFAHIGR